MIRRQGLRAIAIAVLGVIALVGWVMRRTVDPMCATFYECNTGGINPLTR